MDEETKLTRKDFIAMIAGVAGTAVLAKFVGINRAVEAIRGSKNSDGTYGNSSYGGPSA
jgi:hypothetical protein